MGKLYLMTLIPGAIIYWGFTAKARLWDLLLQRHIDEIFIILLYIFSVSVIIFGYGLVVDVTGPYITKEEEEEDTNLECAYLRHANLTGTNLCRAILWKANLEAADLAGANLTGANLMETDLTEADLCGANLTGATLTGANLTEADLWETRNLTIEQLSDVKTLYQAELAPELMERIEKEYPHLLEKPKDRKNV
jgi:hypothetical protein